MHYSTSREATRAYTSFIKAAVKPDATQAELAQSQFLMQQAMRLRNLDERIADAEEEIIHAQVNMLDPDLIERVQNRVRELREDRARLDSWLSANVGYSYPRPPLALVALISACFVAIVVLAAYFKTF